MVVVVVAAVVLNVVVENSTDNISISTYK